MKGKMLVVVAVLLGVAVVFLVNSRFAEYERRAIPPPTRRLYRAAADIQPGVTVQVALDETHVLQPFDGVPESFADANPDFVDIEIEWAKKMTITREMRTGDILQMSHLQAVAEASAAIPDGTKLHTITVDQKSSLGYLIAPGDRVDVSAIWTRSDTTQPGGVAVETTSVANDVLVFAVDSAVMARDGTLVRPRGTPYTSVTFALMPGDIEKVIAAEQRGKLALSLKAKKSN